MPEKTDLINIVWYWNAWWLHSSCVIDMYFKGAHHKNATFFASNLIWLFWFFFHHFVFLLQVEDFVDPSGRISLIREEVAVAQR